MNQSETRQAHAADAFGRAVAARLGAGTEDLPHHVRERLRAARVRALAARRTHALREAPLGLGRGGSASLAAPPGLGPWRRLASALPLLMLAAGLVFLHGFQSEQRAAELAHADAALLTDDLPPEAYADPGFAQFLQGGRGSP